MWLLWSIALAGDLTDVHHLRHFGRADEARQVVIALLHEDPSDLDAHLAYRAVLGSDEEELRDTYRAWWEERRDPVSAAAYASFFPYTRLLPFEHRHGFERVAPCELIDALAAAAAPDPHARFHVAVIQREAGCGAPRERADVPEARISRAARGEEVDDVDDLLINQPWLAHGLVHALSVEGGPSATTRDGARRAAMALSTSGARGELGIAWLLLRALDQSDAQAARVRLDRADPAAAALEPDPALAPRRLAARTDTALEEGADRPTREALLEDWDALLLGLPETGRERQLAEWHRHSVLLALGFVDAAHRALAAAWRAEPTIESGIVQRPWLGGEDVALAFADASARLGRDLVPASVACDELLWVRSTGLRPSRLDLASDALAAHARLLLASGRRRAGLAALYEAALVWTARDTVWPGGTRDLPLFAGLALIDDGDGDLGRALLAHARARGNWKPQTGPGESPLSANVGEDLFARSTRALAMPTTTFGSRDIDPRLLDEHARAWLGARASPSGLLFAAERERLATLRARQGWDLFEAGHVQPAADLLRRALLLRPDDTTRIRLGLVAEAAGRDGIAFDLLVQGLATEQDAALEQAGWDALRRLEPIAPRWNPRGIEGLVGRAPADR